MAELDYNVFHEDEYEQDTSTPETTKQFLTFVSDGIIIGVSTEYVIEIIANFSIRQVPMVPEYLRGVINLRGQVLPIIDMRLIMGKEFREYNDTTCIIILEVQGVSVGLIVDTVLQVQDIDTTKSSIIPTDKGEELTSGMIKLPDGTVALFLNCEAIINQA